MYADAEDGVEPISLQSAALQISAKSITRTNSPSNNINIKPNTLLSCKPSNETHKVTRCLHPKIDDLKTTGVERPCDALQ